MIVSPGEEVFIVRAGPEAKSYLDPWWSQCPVRRRGPVAMACAFTGGPATTWLLRAAFGALQLKGVRRVWWYTVRHGRLRVMRYPPRKPR